jgi:polysaccharide biosynthesis protein PslH
MKILLTLRQPLFPADTGGKVRSLNIFSRLVKRASIHAVSFADPLADAASIQEMQRLFEGYTPVPWRETKKYSLEFYEELVTNQISTLPYFLAKCQRPGFRSTVEALLERGHFDVLFCDFLQTAAPLLPCSFKPKVVFEHNVEFQLRKRKWQVETHPLRKMVFGTEWRRTRPLEARVCRCFDHVLTVSEEDQRTIQHEFGIDHVSTLPTGVDTDYFRPLGNHAEPGRLAFVGSMDWDPNEDGVVWFLESIYPFIRQAVPNASLVVVGRNPSSRLLALARKSRSVEITGWVSDVRPFLSQAEVVVVPLRIGGGTRIKIPEAMAMAKAVVSTPIGAEGLPFQDNQQIRIAEHARDFADDVVELLENARLRNEMQNAARREVTENYGWEAVVDKVEDILRRVTALGKQEPGAEMTRDRALVTP